METKHQKTWWRNSNQLNANIEDRKISWLELFYDLVYVIAISKITHNLSLQLNIPGFLDYFYLLALVYWGWLNGSAHHDLLGANDVRTIFLTIWQIVILSALIVTLNSSSERIYFNTTVVILIMQYYITYLWWSEGIYDKSNIYLNRYYTVIYMLAFVLIFSTFFLHQPYLRIIFYFALILNYLPPYFENRALKEKRFEYRLTNSMAERLGLFTIILFGEVILGVINGISKFQNITFNHWLMFITSIFIVFTLWFIFFGMISDKKVKKGFIKNNIYALLFLPVAMSLGIIGVAFEKIFITDAAVLINGSTNMKFILGIFICLFLLVTFCISKLIETSKSYLQAQAILQKLILGAIVSIFITCGISQYLPLFGFLLIILSVLLVLPVAILIFWNNLELSKP
ncbi:MAG TPA: low temperature requirement protein A [Puia sp.]|nr:low temperature requirement protein A [Puia sp.]